jgi:hypothetical protein
MKYSQAGHKIVNNQAGHKIVNNQSTNPTKEQI